MVEIEKKWFGDPTACLNIGSRVISNNLTLYSFWGLFLIAAAASTCALVISLAMFFYKNWHELRTITMKMSIWQRLITWFKYYDGKDTSFHLFGRDKVNDKGEVKSRDAANIKPSPSIGEQNSNLSIIDLSDLRSWQDKEEKSSTGSWQVRV